MLFSACGLRNKRSVGGFDVECSIIQLGAVQEVFSISPLSTHHNPLSSELAHLNSTCITRCLTQALGRKFLKH
eukprot:scaffold1120_cov127-Cylindrotheca_fusiformis.AAC.8